MANKAFIFDTNTKRTKEVGMSDSEISKVYSIIAKEVYPAGLNDRSQHSIYRTNNGDGINALINLLGHKDRFPLFSKNKERLNWMGCDEYSDVTKAFDMQAKS